MYKIAFDLTSGCLIGASSGAVSVEEWQQAYEAIRAVDQSAAQQKIPSLSILFIDRNSERPNANRRQEMAQLRRELKAPLRLSVFVCESILIRGFLKSIDWIAPKPDNEFNTIVANFHEAQVWAEAQIKHSIPSLSSLYQRLQSQVPFPLPER